MSGIHTSERRPNPGAGNSLRAEVINDEPHLRVLTPLGTRHLLNAQELASLWHLVEATDDVPFVERTRARRLPLPATVGADAFADSFRIGVSAHQGRAVLVQPPTGLPNRQVLAVAKTRRGKSSALLRLAEHLITASTKGAGRSRRGVILVDRHRDLASAPLGLVPRRRQADIVYLDISNRPRRFGINLLNAGPGWDGILLRNGTGAVRFRCC
jgi:hypothetical protein